MKILHFPLVRITVGFVPGIIFASYTKASPEPLFLLLMLCFICLCGTYYFSTKDKHQKIYFGIWVYCLSFFIGAAAVAVHTGHYQKGNYIHQVDKEKAHVLEIVLREQLKSTHKSERYIASVTLIDQKKSSGKILMNFKKSRDWKLPIGTNMRVSGIVFKHKRPYNPDQFDYGNYLLHKSVLAQMYVGPADVKIGYNVTKDALYYADKLRTTIITNLSRNIAKKELHVIAALILGQQQDLAPDLVQDYQLAGAVHILSVSGLHVGFILLFLNFLLKPLPNVRWFSVVKVIIICFSLWGFAILAGLSPSVIRSVTMFSFVAIGMHLKRKTNIFHTLLVSILLILLFEPSYLFDVGFQLSYCALFFILWLQPMLAKIWKPKSRIVDYFWQILTVSFAAQIGAFPLSIYYFHQFPGLFFVTNLVIIPFLSIIMGIGVLVMGLAAFNYVPIIPARILEFAISVLNKTISWIASFDSFIIHDIPMNKVIMASLYVVIIASIICLSTWNYRKIVFVLLSILAFQISCFSTIWKSGNDKEFIVLNVKKSSVFVNRNGHDITVFTNEKIADNDILNSYTIANFSNIKNVKPLKNTAWFNNKKILIIDSLALYPQKDKPDIIVLRQSPKLNLERLLRKYKPALIIADASNYKSYVAIWKRTCTKHKIPFHAVAEKGYYELN